MTALALKVGACVLGRKWTFSLISKDEVTATKAMSTMSRNTNGEFIVKDVDMLCCKCMSSSREVDRACVDVLRKYPFQYYVESLNGLIAYKHVDSVCSIHNRTSFSQLEVETRVRTY